MPDNNDSGNVAAKLASLKANQDNLVLIINKLDGTLTKITDVSTDVARMLAVHESRLDKAEERCRELKGEMKHDFDRVDDTVEKIHEKINNVKDELHADLSNGFTKMTEKFEELKEDNKQYREKITTRYGRIEKLLWIMSGGGAVVGFILAKVLPAFWKYLMDIGQIPHVH